MSETFVNVISNVNNSSSSAQLKYSRQNIQLRRAEVLRLQTMGESESSIARSLGVSQAIISLDVQFLRSQARDKIAEHLDNLGYELDKVLTGLDLLLQKTWS
jgi:biotin operon repressor